jgi:hypothetical protein
MAMFFCNPAFQGMHQGIHEDGQEFQKFELSDLERYLQ